ncbi:MAG: DUF2284 domain-containing protein [Methanomassiliicoccales archaeon]|nr:MAG: DUF2284 domain-containing protein [Methanomassiliicoccales archaeon]
MSADERDLRKLVEKALNDGASRAIAVPASAVTIDPRARMKCQVPVCKNYNHNLMCPPNVMTPTEFEGVLSRFSDAILVQYVFQRDIEKPVPFNTIKENDVYGQEGNDGHEKSHRHAFKQITAKLNELEAEAMRMGYRFATALTGGPCSLCDECVGIGGRCRHPFQARPSMEAMGIDVIATAGNAGLPLEYPARKKALLTGLLLVD